MNVPTKSPSVRDLPIRYFLVAALVSAIAYGFNSTRADGWPPGDWTAWTVELLGVAVIGGLFWGAVLWLIARSRQRSGP